MKKQAVDMMMGSGGTSDEPGLLIDINTTPLIDVMLVLLIMLIITIPVQTHAVKLNMPAGVPPPEAKPPEIVRIAIDAGGTVLWNDERLPGRQELDSRFTALASLPEQPEVHLRPDKRASYKSVVMVMASAQRLGVTKIGLVGSEPLAQR